MSLVGAGTIAALRNLAGDSLAHTYTRTPVTQGSEDAWGDAAATSGTPVTGVACRLSTADTLRIGAEGRVTVSVPTLSVVHTDPLAVGDLVSNVADADGTVLLAGPLTVESLEPLAAAGSLLMKRAVLRAAGVAE